MDFNVFLKLIKKRQRIIWFFVIIFLIISLLFTFIQPLKYSSKSKLLVIQNTSGVDPYTVSKSNEYLGNLFSQVVYSSSFLDLVKSSGYDINHDYFGNNSTKQMKTWGKTVSTNSLGDTGIISINVYHPDPYQARQIALAINDVLINKNFNYQGLGNLVKVTVIDQPIISNYPVKPNIIVNVLAALFGGLVFSFIYIYFLPEEVSFRPFRRRSKKIRPLGAPNYGQAYRASSPAKVFPDEPKKEFSPNLYPKNIINISELIDSHPNGQEEAPREENRQIRGDMNNILNRY